MIYSHEHGVLLAGLRLGPRAKAYVVAWPGIPRVHQASAEIDRAQLTGTAPITGSAEIQVLVIGLKFNMG